MKPKPGEQMMVIKNPVPSTLIPWGNGRPEMHLFPDSLFEERFRIVLQERTSGAREITDKHSWSDERVKQMVLNTFANLGKQSLFIRYRKANGEESERVITPLALTLSSQSQWGMMAVCELRQTMRWFRFDRIIQADPLELVREDLTPYTVSMHLLNLNETEREAILEALSVLDTKLYEKLKPRKVRPKREKKQDKSWARRVSRIGGLNSEGLTFEEWCRAALGRLVDDDWLINQWAVGLDPTEVRAFVEEHLPFRSSKWYALAKGNYAQRKLFNDTLAFFAIPEARVPVRVREFQERLERYGYDDTVCIRGI